MSKGTKYDENKPSLSSIPEEALLGMAQAFAYGAKKYTKWNYRNGLEYTRLTDSLFRHTLAFLSGENDDPESGLPHTFHILANAAMLEFMRARRPSMDDRWVDNKQVSEIKIDAKEYSPDLVAFLKQLDAKKESFKVDEKALIDSINRIRPDDTGWKS